MRHFSKKIALALSLFYSVAPLYSAENLAGKSIAVEGKVSTQDQNLKRGSSVYSKDIISVGQDSGAQIRFMDGGLINIVENTQYRVASYAFTKKEKQVTIELIEGGFRAMTGTIGKVKPTNYTIKTPVATIGVRGTIFDVLFRDGELSVGAVSGNITVKNEGGSVQLSPGNFVTTDSPSSMGTVTNVQPQSLASTNFSPPPGGVSLVQAQASINQNPIVAPVKQPTSDDSPSDPLGSGDYLYIPITEGNPPCG